MKAKIIPLVIVAVAVAAFWFRDRWLPQPPGLTDYLGYVEAETRLIGPLQAGRLVERPAAKGAAVKAGGLLFRLDDTAKKIDVTAAEAALKAAESTRDDLLSGKRQAEIAPVLAQRDQAAAALVLAEQDLARATRLSKTGVTAEQSLDQARAAVAQYQAQVAQFDATVTAYKLAARPDAIGAANAAVAQAKAKVDAARQAVDDLSVKAPADALVDDTYFDVGEYVQAGQPIVSLLQPGDLTLRFFVPEAAVASAQPGTHVTFTCDTCGTGLGATITHTAAQPEYTPPVIYSKESRSKLVFRVEARPDSETGLRPGLPVAVAPLQ